MGAAALARRLSRHRTAILCYHNIVPDEAYVCGERLLHTPLSRFRQDLEILQHTHDIISLDDFALGRVGSSRKPSCCITFDDAYVGCIQLALPELRARSIPSTVFVAPGILGRECCWWDGAADADGHIPSQTRNECLDQLRGQHSVIEAQWPTFRRSLPRWWHIATEAELRDSCGPDILFGGHTWSHGNVMCMNDEELHHELESSAHWIESRFGRSSRRWLAYPYGLFNERAVHAAAKAGYSLAFTLEHHMACAGTDAPLTTPRIPIVNGLTSRGFVARVSGLGRL
jgi:peptidoglycan/xylan/chitin deacetylase (PgdA/CDA1 family)